MKKQINKIGILLSFLIVVSCEGYSGRFSDGKDYYEYECDRLEQELEVASCNLSTHQNVGINQEKTEIKLRVGIKDSLWFVQGNPNDYYRYDTLKSTIKDLPEILVYSLYGLPQLTNVGDIDGDGFDEVGFFSTAYESNWSNYDVYSVRNGRWHELKERPYVFTLGFQELNPLPKIIESLGDGRVKILKMKFDDVAIVCDTIIEPIFEIVSDQRTLL